MQPLARFGSRLLFLVGGALSTHAAQLDGWPAEREERASNLTALASGFGEDLSGAVWNPLTRTLWVCRNGPGVDSRLWVLLEDGPRGLRVGSQAERRGEWKELDDCEGVTFANFAEEVVFLIIEGAEAIHELDVSTYGDNVLKRVYDTSPFLPRAGSDGAEGITFVPDRHLAQAGFVDAGGALRKSRQGMGGLMFVGHQNGGGIYAFDLNRETGAVDFVGEYRVLAEEGVGASARSKVAGLEFDRSTGRLYVWHGFRRANVLSVVELSSKAVEGEVFRELQGARSHRGPSDRNYEGLALVPTQDCGPEGRSLFLTVDDGGELALLRYDRLRLGCFGPEEQANTAPAPRDR